MKAYKTVLRDGDGFLSIHKALHGEGYIWRLGVTHTAPGGAKHSDFLFAYPDPQQALDYASAWAPDGEVVLLECGVEGTEIEGKLYCTRITPLREIPVRRNASLIRGTWSYSTVAGERAPLNMIPGTASPVVEGDGYYWTTPGGRLIEHPNAYRWPKVYHPSTRLLTVGRDWAPLEIDVEAVCSAVYDDDSH